MDLLVSFHSQCRRVKFYNLRSAGAEWGTKLKLVKEPTTPHDPLCVAAWVPGIPSERGMNGTRPLMLGHVAKETTRWLNELLDVPSLQVEQQCHASLTSWGVGSEKNRPLGPEKKRMVGSEKNRSNSKTRNTP